MKIIFSLFALLTLNAYALKVHSLRWPHLRAQGAACQQEAESIALGLHALTGVEIYQATSHFEQSHSFGPERCLVEVLYLGEKELDNLVSTRWSLFHFSNTDLDFDPWNYSSLAQCDSELPGQVALFEEQTGLKALVKDCYAASPMNMKNSIILRILSFGTPKKRPIAFEIPRVKQDQAAYSQKILAAIEARAGVIYRFAPAKKTNDLVSRNYVHYYAAKPVILDLDPDRMTHEYQSLDACTASLADAEEALKEVGATTPASVCVLSPSHSLELHVPYLPHREIEWVYPAYRYGTLEQCRLDRSRALEYYAKKLNNPVLGAFCVYDRLLEEFKMEMLK